MRVTLAVAPRSTCSHCGSLKALDQRVAGSPSTAADAGVFWAFSVLDAVAGLPCDSRDSSARAGDMVTSAQEATRASALTGISTRQLRRRASARTRASDGLMWTAPDFRGCRSARVTAQRRA